MTDNDLEEILQRCDAATNGPWKFWENAAGSSVQVVQYYDDYKLWICNESNVPNESDRENFRFIAHARTDVPMLVNYAKCLLAAIRKHRDYRGDDRCHADDGELYAVLPEGDTRPEKDTAVTIENCHQFIACRQQGREYVSPEREIERLKQENDSLNATIALLARQQNGVAR